MNKLLNTILLSILAVSFAVPIMQAADYFDWRTRTDRYGMPAGIFATTPFPITEASTTYSIVNDEGTHTYNLGTLYYVATTGSDSSNNCQTFATPCASIGHAISQARSGNTTIIVRAGTYSEHSLVPGAGTDDSHRFMIVGYGQERPIVDGGNGTYDIFSRSYAANRYCTLQRLKVQNTQGTGVYLGYKTTYKYDQYYNLIDLEVYNCSNGKAGLSSGNIYYLNADYGWLYHVTSHHTMGHCIKAGDDADYITTEWSVAYECGYWTTMMSDEGITNWVIDGPGSHPSGIDEPSDSGEDGQHYITRYNIVYDTLFYGVQVRNSSSFSVHHNEIYNTPHFDDVPGAATGATGSPQLLLLGQGPTAVLSGAAYANIVHDSSDATSSGITINSIQTGNAVSLYNNLVYNNPLAEIYLYGYPVSSGRSISIYENTLWHNSSSTAAIQASVNWAASEVDLKNNIIVQAGSGSAVALDSNITHTYNLYYAPSGSIGVTLKMGEVNHDPGWISTPSGSWSNGMGMINAFSTYAVDHGTVLPRTYAVDAFRVWRPNGAGWDIGWNESVNLRIVK